jgi:RNA polymerase sigma-70 factor (ECF subfamily)
MSLIKDEILINKAKHGDKVAFEEFYQRYKKQVFTYIYRFVNKYELAEELTQETFINAYMHLDTYSEKGKPLAWIYTIASNLSKNALKSRFIKSEVSLDAPLPESDGNINMLDVLENTKEQPELIIRSKEVVSKIQEVIDSLPLEYKQILLLCDIQGQSYQDVAQILGCKPSTVGSRLFRARKKVAKKIAAIYKEKPRKWFRWKDANLPRKDYPST